METIANILIYTGFVLLIIGIVHMYNNFMAFRRNKDMKELNKYKCIHCNKIVQRKSTKKWIKSYCDKTGKNVRLQIIKRNEK